MLSICAPRFCPGSFTEEQALRAAIATWPPNIRPVVHWSESQEGRKAHAHSDFIEARTLCVGAPSGGAGGAQGARMRCGRERQRVLPVAWQTAQQDVSRCLLCWTNSDSHLDP